MSSDISSPGSHPDGTSDAVGRRGEKGDSNGAEPGSPCSSPSSRASRSWPMLLALAAFAFGIRLLVVEAVREPCIREAEAVEEGDCYQFGGDTQYVAVQAERLVAGDGFVDATKVIYPVGDPTDPGAAHPPGFTLWLALLQLLGADSVGAWRTSMCALGGISVVVVALAAGRLAGRVGVQPRLAIALGGVGAAVDPLIWSREADLLVEGLTIPVTAAFVLACLAYAEQRSLRRAATVGAVVGVAWLLRSEQIALLVLVAPLFLFAPQIDMSARRRIAHFAVAAVVAAPPMTAWILRNWRAFGMPVVSNNGGTALLLGACDGTFSGEDFGWYLWACLDSAPTDPSGDEAANDRQRGRVALDFLKQNPARVPWVMAARVGRHWAIYRVGDTIRSEALLEWHGWTPTRLGVAALWLRLPFAAGGLLLCRRRSAPLSPLLAPVVVSTVSAALFIPLWRFRTPADVALLIAASVYVAALIGRLTSRHGDSRKDEPRVPPP